jgi:putative peptide zinc metalloprotease protein
MQRLTTILLTLVLAAGLAATRPASALAEGGDNAAVAVNTKDGSSLFKFAFAIRRVGGDVVDQTNAAVAYASCDTCQTVAIAIEIVLVTGYPSTVTPTNLALAVNYQCTLCVTVADAYQFVISTGGPVHFTAEGNREIARIRHEIRELGKQNLSVAELQARLDDLIGQLKQVLATQLVPAGQSGEEHGDESDTTESTTTTAPTTNAPTTSESTTTNESTTITTTEPTTTTTG